MKTAAAVLAALIAFMIGLISCTPPATSAHSPNAWISGPLEPKTVTRNGARAVVAP